MNYFIKNGAWVHSLRDPRPNNKEDKYTAEQLQMLSRHNFTEFEMEHIEKALRFMFRTGQAQAIFEKLN